MITLKHLARTLKEDPYKLRKRLRKLFGNVKKKRWQWATEKDKDYVKILTALRKSSTRSTVATPLATKRSAKKSSPGASAPSTSQEG